MSSASVQSAAAAAAGLPDVSADLTAANEALLTTLIESKTPVGTSPNVVYSTTGAGIPNPVSGDLNAVVITAPLINSQVSIPSNYGLVYVTGGDATVTSPTEGVIVAASATNDIVASGYASNTIIAGNGSNTISASQSYIYGGSGQNTMFIGGSTYVNSIGNDTITSSNGPVIAGTIVAAGAVLYFGGRNTTFVASGSPTLVGFSGLLSGNGSSLVFDNGSTTVQAGSGASTIVGSGNTTISGGTGATLYFGSGGLNYIGTAAADTIVSIGGNERTVATVGSAGALIFGGGGDTIQSATGPLTYIGFRTAAITLAGSANNLLALPAGDVDASQSSGSNTIFDNGSVSVLGGSGATAIVSSVSGNSTLNPGAGDTLIIVGNLNSTQRTLTIGNFNGAHDFISLLGYAPNADAAAFQSETFAATPAGTNTTVTLLDGTHIVFQNAQNLAPFSFT